MMTRRGNTYGLLDRVVATSERHGRYRAGSGYYLFREPENTPRARSAEDIVRVLRALHRNGRGMRTRIRMVKLMRSLPYREGYAERFGYTFHKSGELIPKTMPVHIERDLPEYEERENPQGLRLLEAAQHHIPWLQAVPGIPWLEGRAIGGIRQVFVPRWLVRFYGLASEQLYASERVRKASLQYGTKRLRDPGVRGTWETILAVAGAPTAFAWLHAMARRRPVRDQQFIFPDALKAFE